MINVQRELLAQAARQARLYKNFKIFFGVLTAICAEVILYLYFAVESFSTLLSTCPLLILGLVLLASFQLCNGFQKHWDNYSKKAHEAGKVV